MNMLDGDKYATVISNLSARYGKLENLTDKGFFVEIADYIKYISNTPELTPVVNSIQQERLLLEQKQSELYEKLQKDKKKAAQQVLVAIKNKKIKFPELDDAIKEYNLMQSLEDLEDIIRMLYFNGYQKLVEPFVVVSKDKKSILEFKISDSSRSFAKVRGQLIEGGDTALWGALQRLWEIYTATYIEKNLEDNLRTGKMHKDEYSNYASRVHQHIIEQLQVMSTPKNKESSSKKLKINRGKGEIIFQNSKGEIRKDKIRRTSEYNILEFLAQNNGKSYQTTDLIPNLKNLRDQSEYADPKQRVLDKIKAIRKKFSKEIIVTTPDGFIINCQVTWL